ncbi:hypothetical protein EXIGLDRAFT_232661 [Exidia glandulosa HHB12029]|uniref:Uncharacterized protein n=1 Tax=Exidia glandulosa HHB12029 TaxID=1314781 RepID=A0A165E3R7_EXIGL|nr:hypothetical protein EXIGLDRAFT_232661 [Exidia glandulosa HHB12029]
MHKASTEQPVQIFPEAKGCDGVAFIERQIDCPAAAKLYYGSIKAPVVTAKTNIATETTVKVGATVPGVVRDCTEIVTADMVSELFRTSGVCEAATAKGNGGKVMNEVKKLIDSATNRNYVQRRGLFKVKQRVLDTPIMSALTGTVLDSVCLPLSLAVALIKLSSSSWPSTTIRRRAQARPRWSPKLTRWCRPPRASRPVSRLHGTRRQPTSRRPRRSCSLSSRNRWLRRRRRPRRLQPARPPVVVHPNQPAVLAARRPSLLPVPLRSRVWFAARSRRSARHL